MDRRRRTRALPRSGDRGNHIDAVGWLRAVTRSLLAFRPKALPPTITGPVSCAGHRCHGGDRVGSGCEHAGLSQQSEAPDELLMLPIPGAVAEGLPAMSKRLKASPHPDFKLIRGRRGRDVIRVQLPSGGVGFIATTISRKVLAAFAASLTRKIARRKRLARALRQHAIGSDPPEESANPLHRTSFLRSPRKDRRRQGPRNTIRCAPHSE
jgi:hypothetical protein